MDKKIFNRVAKDARQLQMFVDEACEAINKAGLELIEWDGERNFTEEEVAKLLTGKVGVKEIYEDYSNIYLPAEIDTYNTTIYLTTVRLNDDTTDSGLFSLIVSNDGTFEYLNATINALKGVKLYQHQINLESTNIDVGSLLEGGTIPLCIVSTREEPYDFSTDLSLYVGYDGVVSIVNDEGILFGSLYFDGTNLRTSTGLINGAVIYEQVSSIVDTVSEL